MKDFGINPVTGTIALWVLFIAVIVVVAMFRYRRKVKRRGDKEPEEYY